MPASATMVITDANAYVARYHDRMPVILDRISMKTWLGGDDPSTLLRPAPEDAISGYPVSRRVNNARVRDEHSLIEPAQPEPRLFD